MITWIHRHIHAYKVLSLEIKELRDALLVARATLARQQAEIQVLNEIIKQLRYYNGRHSSN